MRLLTLALAPAISFDAIAQNVPARPDPTRFTTRVLVPPGQLDEPMVLQVVNTRYYSAAGVVTEAEEGLFGLAIDPKGQPLMTVTAIRVN